MIAKSLAQIITILGLALATVIKTSQYSYADSITFFCGISDKKLATIAESSQGKIPLFIWTSEYFSGAGYTPHRRCLDTSSKLQTYHSNHTLNYIFAKKQANRLVVCVASQKGGGCFGELFTLPPNFTNPNHVLQRILRIGNQSDIVIEVEDRIYIDINKYLNKELVNRRGTLRGVYTGGTSVYREYNQFDSGDLELLGG